MFIPFSLSGSKSCKIHGWMMSLKWSSFDGTTAPPEVQLTAWRNSTEEVGTAERDREGRCCGGKILGGKKDGKKHGFCRTNQEPWSRNGGFHGKLIYKWRFQKENDLEMVDRLHMVRCKRLPSLALSAEWSVGISGDHWCLMLVPPLGLPGFWYFIC